MYFLNSSNFFFFVCFNSLLLGMVAESINGSCLRDTDCKITYLVDKGNMFDVVFLDISMAAYAILHNFECFVQL